jgi:hypothetical protein
MLPPCASFFFIKFALQFINQQSLLHLAEDLNTPRTDIPGCLAALSASPYLDEASLYPNRQNLFMFFMVLMGRYLILLHGFNPERSICHYPAV